MNRFAASIFTIFFCAFCAVFFQNCAEDLKSNADSYVPNDVLLPELPDPRLSIDPNAIQLSVLDTAAVQGSNLVFTVRVSKASDKDITVALESNNGSALSGRDFTGYNNSVIIPKGKLSVNVTIPTPITGFRSHLQMSLVAVSVSEGNIHYPIGLGTIAPLGTLPYPAIHKPIGVGNLHSCAIGSGTLGVGATASYCWGAGTLGTIGNNVFKDSPTPLLARDTEKIKSIVSGLNHNCGLYENKVVRCWGSGQYHQIGNNKPAANHRIPAVVSDGKTSIVTIRQISAGYYSTCGLLENGTVKCWGNNTLGELGNGTNTASIAAVEVKDLYNIREIAVGGSFACALRANGTVYCWGNNAQGQLARAVSTKSSFTPLQISGITDAKSIAAGAHHACALLNDGQVKCWGVIGANTDYHGQLGHGLSAGSATPVLVKNITGAKSIEAGAHRTCVIDASNNIQCWGRHYSTATGAYSATPTLVPITIKDTAGATNLVVGYTETCFQAPNKAYKCWGAGRISAYTARGTPTVVTVP